MYDVTEIKRYILYLKNTCGLAISIHPAEEDAFIVHSELMRFAIHDNSYCACVKTCPQAYSRCLAQQKKVHRKYSTGPFCGTCHAGVKEFVYPIMGDGKYMGFISVSGYRDPAGGQYTEALAKVYPISRARLEGAYMSLKPELPSREALDTLIAPLCRMLELAYLKTAAVPVHTLALPEQVMRYIRLNHTRSITLGDICAHFGCSRSHISHSFKAHTGCHIREYLTTVRLEDARSLLHYSDLSVTEIAFSVGFSDSNYFSNVFKKYTGMSPLAYRRSVRTG